MNPDDNYWDNLMESDDVASTYMDGYGEGPDAETRFIIGAFINDGESVLDVGCGPGWNCDHFRDYGPEVEYLAVDLSPRFVRIANKRISEKYGDEPVAVGDCRKLKFPDKYFDVVILQDILEHTNGHEETMNEALRVAKKRIIITFWRMKPDIQTKTNDDRDKGTDGWATDYNQGEWEDYLNSLPYPWMDTEDDYNRKHKFYIIDMEEK